ncbi:MAG: glycoside hydrolase family 127 protein [Chitinophagaceae bacterium]|nr:glycoside hydrolase family 127 protein [Chitinophagaceae bacterium]
MNQNLVERLLKIDEEGILDGYLQRPGHHPWAGEHIGKYLEAACNVWKNTHNAELKIQMDRLMYLLIHSQKEDGYLGTYTQDEYWTSWDVWSHKYNLYGLLAYYNTTGYKPALEACKKMGNLLCATFGNKSGQKDIILAGTHVGMAATSILDPMVELYRYTGDKKYLDFCYYILEAWEQNNGPKIISRLLATGNVKDVGNGKAYEMISNFTGLAKLYRVTADKKILTPILIAWKSIADNKLYITGTTSSMEYFQNDNKLPAEINDHIGEGCVTTTWIQFNKELLAITGDIKYLEQIENSIYNHLLAAENPQTGCVSYYTPLMGAKPYTCYITCCQSSVPRGIALTPNFTVGTVKNILTLMLYEPASYHQTILAAGKKINLSINVVTNFPETDEVTVVLNTSQTAFFPISLRVPGWCTSFTASVGNTTYTGISNQYLTLNRLWKTGEKIKISFKMPVQIIGGGSNYPNLIAYKRGPQVLALDESLNGNFLKLNTLEAAKLLPVENNFEKVQESILPKQWIGKQVYSVKLATTKKDTPSQNLLLVPFADAGQNNGTVKVWLPLHIYK